MRVDHKSRVVSHQMLKYSCCILGINCDYHQWRKWRFELWGENLPVAERGPITNTKKKTWEMMLSPDVDGYTKTQNPRKIHFKNEKTTSC